MSTPDQPNTPLTRRQLRELRNTAATPIISADSPVEPDPPVAAPLARAAEPASVPPAPEPDASVDLEATPTTRRQARLQERLRTASVPVITDEIIAAHQAAAQDAADAESAVDADAGVVDAEATAAIDGAPAEAAVTVDSDVTVDVEAAEEVDREHAEVETGGDDLASDTHVEADHADEEDIAPGATDAPVDLVDAPVVDVELPPSFDHLLSRGSTTTGSLGAANALILSQTPETGSLVSPVTSTGEVLITGTFALPEHYGSTGTVPGSADGKDIDAALVDGELPAASSPMPIAASSAISTIKSAEDVIRPPAPEKGSRLMMALAITAGILALALAGVLILAIVNGVF